MCPIYTFENTNTGEIYDEMISFTEMETLLKTNPHIKHIIKPVRIVDPVGIGVTKPPEDFQKFVLGKVKAANPQSEAVASKRWNIPKEI